MFNYMLTGGVLMHFCGGCFALVLGVDFRWSMLESDKNSNKDMAGPYLSYLAPQHKA